MLTIVEVLTAIQDGDVVYLDWPDGAESLVKGEKALRKIIRTGRGRQMRIMRLPVSNDREAEVIAAGIKLVEAGQFHLTTEASFCRMLDLARLGMLS